MTDKAKLLELAERCEAATGPDRELDDDIVAALHRSINFNNLTARKWAEQFWVRDDDDDMEPIRFTASLDAAMTLIPEGAQYTIEPDGCWLRFRDASEDDGIGKVQSVLMARGGKCTALAICSAALKALSVNIGEEGK